jgi:WD40 repeat protein
VLSRRTRNTSEQGPAHDRPDVFLSYSRVDKGFAEGRLTKALADHGKDVWIDVEDIRGGASDWRATVWAGIEAAKVVVFVLTPDSLASTVCGEELAEAERLNKRIVPLLHRSVKGLPIPEAISKPNWVNGRPEDDFETSVRSLIDAIELDEPWVEQHARLSQRTGEWLRHDRDGSYLLRGSDLRAAEQWLDDQAGHDEAPTTDQITYITASRRAAARRQRSLLAGVAVALLVTAALAIAAVVQRQRAIDREKTARAQARAAQSIAALSRDPEESVRDALAAVKIRPNLPEAMYALRRAVSSADWTSILRLPDSRDIGLQDVEFSRDGSRVATGGSDGGVAIWETRTGRLVAKTRTGGAVHTVQFSPDGRQLLTASDGRYARTWDSSTGKPLRKFDTGSRVVWAATWGANGQRILTATLNGGEVWDSNGRRILHLSTDKEGQHPGAIKMSLDGRRALTAGKKGAAWLWDLTTKRKKPLPGKDHGSRLSFTLFSRDGRRFVTSYESGAFCVWVLGRLSAPSCPPEDAPRTRSTDWDLSQDGRRVLQVSETNGDVLVWDVRGARPRRIARLPNGGSVASAQFSRDGKYVVTGGDDGFARIWQVKPTRLVALLHGHTRGVRRARFSPDGKQVATVSDDGSGRLWSARPNTPDRPAWQSAESTSFSPNSRDVLVIRGERRAVWNTVTGKVVELDEGRAPISSPASWPCGHAAGCAPWSPTGRLVAGATADGRAAVWNPHTGRVEQHFGEIGAVLEAAFSPDGRHLIVVDGNRSRAQIWQVSPKAEEGQIPATGRGRGILAAAQFLANPLRVVTVDSHGAVQVSPAAGGATATLPGAAYPAAVAATDDGRIAVGTIGGFLHVYSARGLAGPTKRATDKSVTSLEFSPAGGVLALGGQTGTSSIWNLRTLTPTQLRAFGGEISGVTFSPDGNFVLVTSGTTARLWDRTLRRVLVELPRTGNVQAEFSPDGHRIAIAGTNRLEVLPCIPCLPQEKLEERARSLLPAG